MKRYTYKPKAFLITAAPLIWYGFHEYTLLLFDYVGKKTYYCCLVIIASTKLNEIKIKQILSNDSTIFLYSILFREVQFTTPL